MKLVRVAVRLSRMIDPLTSLPPEPLQEEFFLTDAARLRRWMPWMHLGATLRMAFDPRKLILAMMALGLLSIPMLIRATIQTRAERVPAAPAQDALGESNSFRVLQSTTAEADSPHRKYPWSKQYLFQDHGAPMPNSRQILSEPGRTLIGAVTQGPQILTPVAQVLTHGQTVIESKFRWGRSTIQLLELLWIWGVWAVFGTLICRLTALDFMGRDVGWGEAWKYCRSRTLSAFASPLLPMIGVAGFWLPCVVGGWITRIPTAGPPLVAMGWLLLWGCGAALALLLMGLTLCWPMMIATVGVEGTDAFDGLSRSYNYLFSRPWYVIWMSMIMLGIGGCAMFGVRWLAGQADSLALISLASGAPDRTLVHFETFETARTTTGSLLRGSHSMIRMGVHAFAHSYFWVAVTVIFLLLRKSVDSTPLDHLSEDRQRKSGELPLAGIAASTRREQAAAPAQPVPGG